MIISVYESPFLSSLGNGATHNVERRSQNSERKACNCFDSTQESLNFSPLDGKPVLREPEGRQRDGDNGKYLYHHDGLGSIIGMTNTQGSVVQSYRYDEFGRVLQEASPLGPHGNYKYTAQEYDGDISEVYNYRARYYDPEIGRFTQEDLLHTPRVGYPTCASRSTCSWGAQGQINPQGLNQYTYAENNPTNYVDPLGLERCTAERVESEMMYIWAAFRLCCKPTWPPGGCYEKVENIIECMWPRIRTRLHCCRDLSIGVIIPPPPLHYGLWVTCVDDCGIEWRRPYEPFRCKRLPEWW